MQEQLQDVEISPTTASVECPAAPDPVLHRLEAARAKDRAKMAGRKAYLQWAIPWAGRLYLPLVIVLCNAAFVFSSPAAETLSSWMLRGSGSSAAGGDFLMFLHLLGIQMALMALAMLLNVVLSDRLSRWQQALTQELETYGAADGS